MAYRAGTASLGWFWATPSTSARWPVRSWSPVGWPDRGAAWFSRLPQQRQYCLDPTGHVPIFGQSQLVEDRVDVVLHGPLGEGHCFRYSGIVAALGHQLEDLPLAASE